ncbi:MAG: LPS assembly lipoprotein LptE [Thiobacillus sp.]|nr:lipoprotein B transmembrane [Gammaproteobacteria bacterium]MDP1926832.1 LPS assembly lipoprotein LptE [Thiobacillus sp.]
MKRRLFLALLPAALAAGCGFQLRRYDGLPFGSLYIDAPGSAVTQRLRVMLATDKAVRLTDTAGEAEAVLKITQEERIKSILTLTGGGRVSEYRLSLKLAYVVLARDGRVLAAPESLELQRIMTYNDALLLAKGAEEQLLYRDMDDDAALRIVRRMQTLKPDNGK